MVLDEAADAWRFSGAHKQRCQQIPVLSGRRLSCDSTCYEEFS